MMDQLTRGSAQSSLVGLGRREREFADAYVESNRVFLRDFLEGLPEVERDAYIAAKSREWAMSWTREFGDPAYVAAREASTAAESRVLDLRHDLAAVS